MTNPIQPQSPRQTPAHGWTTERQTRFLDALSNHGNARAACRAVGLSAEAAYKLRRRDPLFARAWAAAVVLGRDNSVATLGERAIEGVEEPIYYRGELIGTRRRYDSRLLLAHLARLDRLVEDADASADAGRFDELLAAIAEDAAELPDGRLEAMERAGLAAGHALRRHQTAEHPELFEHAGDDLSVDEEERLAEFDAACEEAAMDAAVAAGESWDRRRGALFAAVDALSADGGGVPGAGPAALPATLAALVVRRPVAPAEEPTEVPAASFPCTASTVSTGALARAMAGPLPFRPPAPPRSPLRRR